MGELGTSRLSIDDATRSLMTMDYEHHEIHAGSHYFYADYALTQASAAVIEFIFTAPDTTKWPHLVFSVSASTGATVELYKGPTTIVGGTAVAAINNNGNSANTAGSTILKDPTSIGDDGVRAAGYLSGGSRSAGATSRDHEILLEQGAVYLIRITSLAANNDIGWDTEWYEHTNK